MAKFAADIMPQRNFNMIHFVNQFVNGRLVEHKIIAQFSSIAQGDIEKLEDMYSTLQMCTNMTSKLRRPLYVNKASTAKIQ
jgi:hypothetical protein